MGLRAENMTRGGGVRGDRKHTTQYNTILIYVAAEKKQVAAVCHHLHVTLGE